MGGHHLSPSLSVSLLLLFLTICFCILGQNPSCSILEPIPTSLPLHKRLDQASQGSAESPLLERLKSHVDTTPGDNAGLVLNDLRELFQPK